MILCLDTSTAVCRIWLIGDDGATLLEDSWEAGRELSTGLLAYLEGSLKKVCAVWGDVSGIAAYRGPGSFTGLRIGLTVLNTFSRAQKVPIIGATGENWRETGLARLARSEDDVLVMPVYGASPNITKPRK